MILAEVNAEPAKDSLRAIIARFPAPSVETFSGRSVSNSNCWFPQSVPISYFHFVASGDSPAAPSKLSSQTSCQSRSLMRLSSSQEMNAAAVMINDHTAFRVDWMPFGGRDSSGLGVGGIKYSMEDMSRDKLLVFKSKHL